MPEQLVMYMIPVISSTAIVGGHKTASTKKRASVPKTSLTFKLLGVVHTPFEQAVEGHTPPTIKVGDMAIVVDVFVS